MHDLIATCTQRICGEYAIILIIPYNELINITACHRRRIEIRMCCSNSKGLWAGLTLAIAAAGAAPLIAIMRFSPDPAIYN